MEIATRRASNCEHLFSDYASEPEREREERTQWLSIFFQCASRECEVRAENIFFMAFQGQMLPFFHSQYLDLKVIHAISFDCVIERARFH